MDERAADKLIAATQYPRRFAAAAFLMLAVFLFAAAIAEFKSIRFIGSGVAATNTVSVSGTADVFAIPNTAQFSATVMETAADVKSAQDAASNKVNDIVAYLKGAGVDETDIQTIDYSVSPQYAYQQAAVCTNGYCPPGKQVLTGYEVSETLSVKVRDTKKAGDLLAGVGSRGASSVSSLDLTVANQDALEAQARDKAIVDAKTKAEQLAKSLGVSLVRIVGFSENGNSPIPYPTTMSFAASADSGAPAAPELATGQNKITSNVTLMYEIE